MTTANDETSEAVDFGEAEIDGRIQPYFVLRGQRLATKIMSIRQRRKLMDDMRDSTMIFDELIEVFMTDDAYEALLDMDDEKPLPPDVIAKIARHLTQRAFGAEDPKQPAPSRTQRRARRK